MLLDSNILIYASLPGHSFLRNNILEQLVSASVISRIETLGYHRLTHEHERYLEKMFAAVAILPITDTIVDRSILLRQQRRMGLGDAIIAASALEHGMDLWTRNIKDFSWVSGLVVHDPFGGVAAGTGSLA
ncbi:MAG: type II toxin-antitoxin system VapC family toxin [Magnetococcales bacterium]|nr:type II toxin-antitoxin system VapC family toxin [Magnetococcales bacterium]